jgi:hypothetical protein
VLVEERATAAADLDPLASELEPLKLQHRERARAVVIRTTRRAPPPLGRAGLGRATRCVVGPSEDTLRPRDQRARPGVIHSARAHAFRVGRRSRARRGERGAAHGERSCR